MNDAQYGILRFAKYKGPEIGRIEAHDERTKKTYASNPDVNLSRSHLNYHLIRTQGSYRAQAERQIRQTGCRVRSDSVRLVETIVTASPEFFRNRGTRETRAYFEAALAFLSKQVPPEHILSAVVHMDEKTPHMHLVFVPITQDGRLSAKEIIGNRKKLIWWQDQFWAHMVKRWPELERGESASKTGRTHIPPRLFKEMTRLTRQREKLEELLTGITPLNAKGRAREIAHLLDAYIPSVEKMDPQMKKYRSVLTQSRKEADVLRGQLAESRSESTLKKMKDLKLQHDYAEALSILERIPPQLLTYYKTGHTSLTHDNSHEIQEDQNGKS